MQSSNEKHMVLLETAEEKPCSADGLTTIAEYKELFDNAPIGIYCATTEGYVLKANSALLKMLGYNSLEEMQVHSQCDDWQTRYARKYFNKLLERHGKISGMESIWSKKDGSLMVVRESARVTRNPDGTINHYQGYIEDISHWEKAENELKKSQQDYIDLLNDIDGVVWAANSNPFKYTFVSKQAERILGYPLKQWFNETSFWKKHIHPEDRDWVLKVCHEAVKDSRDHWIEYRMIAANGQIKWIRDNVTAVINEEQVMKLKGIMIDITETKEKDLRHDTQEALMDIMVDMNTRFLHVQRLENIGILANVIAHDLNNVFSPVVMTLPLLKRRYTDAWSQKVLSTLEVTTKRGVELVTQILTFARGVDHRSLPIEVNPTIVEVERIIKETFPENIEIVCELPADLWKINADGPQLRQVLMNLCINSRDAMPTGGTLKIKVENFFADESYCQINDNARVGQYIMITVSDTGIGIPCEVLNKIFDPFFTTKDNGKNMGLGLAAVFNIVKNRGGFTTVTSKSFIGTEFKLFFPALAVETFNADRQMSLI